MDWTFYLNIFVSSEDGLDSDIHENHDFHDLWTDWWPHLGNCTYLETPFQSEKDISVFLPVLGAVI